MDESVSSTHHDEQIASHHPHFLTQDERQTLLDLARSTLEAQLSAQTLPSLEDPTERLSKPGAAFVSIYCNGKLRGCIGTFARREPLWQVVQQMALMAASQDPRFGPVQAQELPNLSFELSILSEPTTIKEVAEIEIGRDGLIITDDSHRGVLLPQVAEKHQWNREQFLTHTCIKAALPPDAWKAPTVNIATFQAEIIAELQ